MRRVLPQVLLGSLILVACSATQEPPDWPAAPMEAPTVIAQQEPVPIAVQMAGQADILTVRVTDTGLEPAHLAAAVGSRVKLHVKNTGTTTHNLVIPRFGIVSRGLGPDEENYVEFTASAPGEWPFFSDAAPGDSDSLHGILKVE